MGKCDIVDRATRGSGRQAGGVLAVVAAVYAVMAYIVPLALDDYVFIDTYMNALSDAGSEFSLRRWMAFASTVRSEDNGRLANILSPISTLFTPKWLYAAITGCVTAAYVWLLARLVRGSKPDWRLLAAVWAVVLVALPWRNNLFVADYELNYIYTGMLLLATLLEAERAAEGKAGVAETVAAGAMAFVAGWMHEGFSAALAFGAGVWAIGVKFKMPAKWWAVMIALGCGMLVVLTAPGVWLRFDAQHGPQYRSMAKVLAYNYVSLAMIALLACMLLVRAWRRQLRGLLSCRLFVVSIGASLVGLLYSFAIRFQPRMAVISATFAIVAIGCIVRHWRVAKSVARCGALHAIVMLLCLLFMANVIRVQNLLTVEAEAVIKLMKSSAHGVAFYDIRDHHQNHLSTLGMPLRLYWVEGFSFSSLAQVLDKDEPIAVVPVALRNARLAQAEAVPGDAGMRLLNGCLVGAPIEGYKQVFQTYYDVTLADGRRCPSMLVLCQQFVSEAGERMMYYRLLDVPSTTPVAEVNLIK